LENNAEAKKKIFEDFHDCLSSKPQNPAGNLGFEDDIKDEIGRNACYQPSKDGRLPGLGLHNLEQQANEEEGIDEESNLFERKGVSGYCCQNDDDIPPTKRLLRGRNFCSLLSCPRLKKACQRKDEHDKARTEREKARPGVVNCSESQSVSFDTSEKRKEKPEKIAIKENALHPRSSMTQLIYYPPEDVNG
jgi:hypothetical protein